MKNNLMLLAFYRFFHSIVLILNFYSTRGFAEVTPSCLSPSQKESTVQQFLAVKRTYACRNSLDFQSCQLSLGLGVGAAIGAAAAYRVRSPNFHFCPITTSSFFYHLLKINSAVAAVSACHGIDELLKMRAVNSITTSQKDLDRQLEEYKGQKKIAEKKKNAIQTRSPELYYEAQRSLIDQQLKQIESSHPDWVKLEAATKELDQKFIEWKIASREGKLDVANQLKKDRENLKTKMEQYSQNIKKSPEYKKRMKEYDLATKEHFDFIKDPSVAQKKLAELDSEIQKMNEYMGKIIQEKKDLAGVQKKLNERFLKTQELDQILDELYAHGASSPESFQRLDELKTMDKLKQVSYHNRKTGFKLPQRLTELNLRRTIRGMGARLGLVGGVLSFASAAASADSMSHAAENLLMESTPIPISSVGCGEISRYFLYENKDNRCQPNFSLDRQGSSSFYQLSVEEMLKEVQSDPRLCALIQSGFQESFEKHESVKCGPMARINYANGNYVQILSRSPANPLEKLQWKDAGKTYTMVMKSQKSVDSVHVLNWVGSSYRGDDPEALVAQQNLHSKFLSDVVETLACCDGNGVRPTDQECQKKGVSLKEISAQVGSASEPAAIQPATK